MSPGRTDRLEFLQGTLELLLLKTLLAGELHGYGIAQSIRQASNEALLIEAGSLYPALQRLELQGLIKAEWKSSDTGRQARFYKLTPAGRKKLTASISRWEEFVAAIGLVLHPKVVE
ncbi:MAG TPA: PadR family transcriptional regulator [Bryobacteraceae bacterium]|jgi:transcriptional regulator|nr:PadR family transcriptional regulator [Bryobacteraceae bacterium]